MRRLTLFAYLPSVVAQLSTRYMSLHEPQDVPLKPLNQDTNHKDALHPIGKTQSWALLRACFSWQAATTSAPDHPATSHGSPGARAMITTSCRVTNRGQDLKNRPGGWLVYASHDASLVPNTCPRQPHHTVLKFPTSQFASLENVASFHCCL